MSSLASLPDDVLKLVMQHVPVKHRLTCCCLVSRKLHTAAVAATEALQFGFDYQSLTQINWQTEAVTHWLSLYGKHLTSLVFDRPTERWPLLQQLPCQSLLELKLSRCNVQVGATADGQPGVIQGCPKLTRLEFYCSIIEALEGGLIDSLSSLVDLQHLSLRGLKQVDDNTVTHYTIGGLSDVTLPRLKHLTHLTMHGINDHNLLQLQHLSSLKWLLFQYAGESAVGPHSIPGLGFPASLTFLSLWSPVEAGLLSLVPTGLQVLRLSSVFKGPGDVPGSILSNMARLQHLTELVLWPGFDLAWPPASMAYSALTASSHLATLELAAINWPEGVWPYVFSAVLPNLTSLSIPARDDDGDVLRVPLLRGGDLFSLASCPRLCDIQGLPLQPGRHVSMLRMLTALTYLDAYLGPADVADLERSLNGLAAVTQLRLLWITLDSQDLKVASLLPLTQLTNLTQFDLTSTDYDSDEEGEDAGSHLRMGFWNTAQMGAGPNVWLQLLERCAADADCQPKAVRGLAQQLAEQRALAQAQEQRLALQEQNSAFQLQQIAALNFHVSTLQQIAIGSHQQALRSQQQVIALEQQLAAHQQIAAEQAVQIAGLQQQLQQVLQHLKQ